MLGQAGVVVFESHFFETLGKVHGVLAVFLHADVEGVEVLEDGGAAHGVEHGAEEHAGAVVDIDEAANVLGAATDGTGHTVVGAVDILGHAVDGDVGTQLAGAENHGGEGVVDDELGTGGMGHLAQLGDVGDAEQGVVHGFGVDDLGVGVLGKGFLDGIEVLHVDEGGFDTKFLEVVGHEGEGAAIGGHGADNVVAAFDLVEQGTGDGCEAGAGDPGCLGAFHGREGLAEGEVGGVPVAAVEKVALGFAVEGFGHEVCLGEGEGGAVADGGVDTTVGVAAVETLDGCCGIEFFHVLLVFWFIIVCLFFRVGWKRMGVGPEGGVVAEGLFVEEEDGGPFVEVGRVVEPLAGEAGPDVLGGKGEVGGDTDAGEWLQLMGEIVEELVVAVGGLDEDLRLVVAVDGHLDALEKGVALAQFDGCIAVEGEVLSVESGGHEGQHDAAGPHEGHHLDAAALGFGGDEGAGVGDTGEAGLGHETDVAVVLDDGVEVADEVGGGGVLVELEELNLVEAGGGVAHALEVAPCGALVLYDEGGAGVEQLTVVGRERGIGVFVADGDGEEDEFCGHDGGFFIFGWRLRLYHHEVADFFLGEFAVAATGKVFLGEAGENHAVEFENIVAEVLEDAAHDAVFAAVEFYTDNAFVVGTLDVLDIVDMDGAVLELDAL